jgi:sugar phosphate isomerase/epimerase
VRVNAFGDGPPAEVQGRVAESLNRLAEAAAPQGLDVLVENHGDLAADADWLVELVRRADHESVGVLADFGNWSGDRYASVARVMPWARGVSAKSYDFAPDGWETLLDYERLLQIVRDSGYRGYIAVEYEGTRLDEPDGIQATRALVDRILSRDKQSRSEKKP